MQSVGDRLKIWRSYLGTTQPAFAELIGIHVGMLKKYETGKTIPGGEKLIAIATTGLNLHWLLTGEGDREVVKAASSISDESGIPERIRIWRESLRMKEGFFASLLGIVGCVIEDFESGKMKPSKLDLENIAETGVNLTWLLTGKGEMRSGIPLNRLIRLRFEDITPNSLDALGDGVTEKSKNAVSSAVHSIQNEPPAPSSIINVDDLERLTLAIETVEEALIAMGRVATPLQRAKLYTAAYDLLIDMEPKENIIKFIKLAA